MAQLIEHQTALDDLVSQTTIGGYSITRDDVENSLRPTLGYVEALLNLGAEYYLEQRVAFPSIAGAFGTVDLIIRIGTTISVIDFKFGSGVRVQALYPDGEEDVVNAQLLFYAAGARHSLPQFFAGVEQIVLTILQPTSIEEDAELESTVTVTHGELDEFITLYRARCVEALEPAPHLERGAHCRFCPARPICPAHTGPLLDLAQFAMPAPVAGKQEYLRALAEGLNLVDAIKDLRTALHEQAKRALETGDDVPGYALSAGRAVRGWHDERAAIDALIELGLGRADLVDETMRSPKQVELRAKAHGLKIPEGLISSHRSGVSLVRSENVRAPVPGRGEIAQSFSRALSGYLGGPNHGEQSQS
jgi:hypothetical protein